MKPSMAVQKALEQLENRPEYSLQESAILAAKFLGKDADTYKEAFLLSGLKKKIKDTLRYRPEDNNGQGEMNFMTKVRQRRFPVKQDDGQYKYKLGDYLNWKDLMTILNERRAGTKSRQKEDDAFEAFMSEVAPVMALNPSLQLKDAVNMVAHLSA